MTTLNEWFQAEKAKLGTDQDKIGRFLAVLEQYIHPITARFNNDPLHNELLNQSNQAKAGSTEALEKHNKLFEEYIIPHFNDRLSHDQQDVVVTSLQASLERKEIDAADQKDDEPVEAKEEAPAPAPVETSPAPPVVVEEVATPSEAPEAASPVIVPPAEAAASAEQAAPEMPQA